MWTRVTFAPSPSVAAATAALSGQLAAVRAAWASGVSALGLIPAELGSGGDNQALLTAACACLVVTPYQQGVGQRRGDRGYLTPLAAVRTLAQRLGGDSVQGSALLLLLLAAPDESSLAATLSTWNAVCPLLELQQAERRAQALAELERTKFTVPSPPEWPAWRPTAPVRDHGRATVLALGGQAAVAEGIEAPRSGDILAAFAARRLAALAAQEARLAAAQDRLVGNAPGWYSATLTGTPSDMARALARSEPPLNAAYKCSVAVCWCGIPQQLAYYREIFGI